MSKLLITPHQIECAVLDISDIINNKYSNSKTNPILSPIMQGGVTFFSDIAKFLSIDAYVDYIGVSSYRGQSQCAFDVYKTWSVDLTDKEVWLIDDIADSGNTLAHLESEAYARGASKVYKATLLRRKTCPIPLDFYGFELDKEFVFGYGMDHPNGLGRLSDSIYVV